MKKIVTFGLGFWLGLISALSGSAKTYVELKSGLCIPQKKAGVHFNEAPCTSAELGMAWNSWRFGLQLGYTHYEIGRADTFSRVHGTVFDNPSTRFTGISAMANIYYDWQLCEKTTLYVGCGLGIEHLNFHFYDAENGLNGGERSYNQSKYLLAIQVMCGATYALNDHWSLTLGYRCMERESIQYNVIEDPTQWPSLKTPLLHSLEVGLRYSF